MSFFLDLKEDEGKITIRYTVYPLIMIFLYGVITVWFLTKMTEIDVLTLSIYLLIGVYLFSSPFWKVMRRIRRKVRAGEDVKMSGSKFSIRHPRTVVIPKNK